jgi:hypothetical protein
VQKGDFYQATTNHAGMVSSFSVIDRKIHAKKRRILAPGMTDRALVARENTVLHHVREFFDQAPKENAVPASEVGEKWIADMGTWGNYLTFDVMADMTFGKQLHLIRSGEYRELPAAVDVNVWWASLVCKLSFLKVYTDESYKGRFISHSHEIRP